MNCYLVINLNPYMVTIDGSYLYWQYFYLKIYFDRWKHFGGGGTFTSNETISHFPTIKSDWAEA